MWRTDRVNERILINTGILLEVTDEDRLGVEYPFTTDGYLHGSEDYVALFVDPDGKMKKKIRNIKVEKTDDEGRYSNLEDGILLPNYRLPTEAEWDMLWDTLEIMLEKTMNKEKFTHGMVPL